MAENADRSFLSLVVRILRADPQLLLDILAMVRKVWQHHQGHIGVYEVLKFDVQLELCDSQGETAIYSKQERVRFLQNNVVAYQDMAWGDGDLFAEYHCSPGIAVDRYKEGHRYRVLISLRKAMNTGDIEEFNIRRVIRGGLTQEIEDLQTEIDHTTKHMCISLIFPVSRLPQHVWVVEQHSQRTIELSAHHRRFLADGRLRITWERENPKLYEAYILRWKW